MNQKNGPVPTNKTPEKIDIKKPGMWTIKVTPELAFHWLTHNFDHNRRLTPGHVNNLADEMRAGRWKADHPDAILFSWDGDLIQGQHRLSAVVEAECEVWMRVETGVDPALYPYLDGGIARRLEDRVRLVENPIQNKIVIMLINWLRARDVEYNHVKRTSPEVAHAVYIKHKKSLDWMVRRYRQVKGVSRVPVLAALLEYFEQDDQKAEKFAQTLLSNNGEGPCQQARVLRDTLLRNSSKGIVKADYYSYEISVAAMKAHRDDREVQILRSSDW